MARKGSRKNTMNNQRRIRALENGRDSRTGRDKKGEGDEAHVEHCRKYRANVALDKKREKDKKACRGKAEHDKGSN